jgi:hypothetical protein
MFLLWLLACGPKDTPEPHVVSAPPEAVAEWLQKFALELPAEPPLPADGETVLPPETATLGGFPVNEATITTKGGVVEAATLRVASGGSMAIEQLEVNASEMCLTLEPKVGTAPCRGYTATGVAVDVRTWREGSGDDEVGNLSVLVGRGAPELERR